MVFRVLLVDAGKEIVVLTVVGDCLEFVATTVAEGGADDVATVFLALAVEGEHHFGVLSLRIVHAVVVAQRQFTGGEGLIGDVGLVAPCSTDMADPHIAAADGQHGGGERGERHRAFLLVCDLSPCLDHIHIAVGAVFQVDKEIVYGILEMDGCDVAFHVGSCDDELCREVAVGVAAGKGSRVGTVHAIGGIGIHAPALWTLQCLQVCAGEF